MSEIGFLAWLDAWYWRFQRRICWFIGHRWNKPEWRRSRYTTATHTRTWQCQRCGHSRDQDGYFDALKHPEMFRDGKRG